MMNEKTFNVTLKAINANGEKLADAIHNAGLFAISQANEHGNTGFGVRLMDAIGKKLDAKRVEKWLCTFGKFGIKEGVLIYRKRKDIGPENLEAVLQKADQTPYWELSKQEHHKFSVNYLSELLGMLKKHEKAEKLRTEGKEASEDNVAILDEVKALIAKYQQQAATAAA